MKKKRDKREAKSEEAKKVSEKDWQARSSPISVRLQRIFVFICTRGAYTYEFQRGIERLPVTYICKYCSRITGNDKEAHERHKLIGEDTAWVRESH